MAQRKSREKKSKMTAAAATNALAEADKKAKAAAVAATTNTPGNYKLLHPFHICLMIPICRKEIRQTIL